MPINYTTDWLKSKLFSPHFSKTEEFKALVKEQNPSSINIKDLEKDIQSIDSKFDLLTKLNKSDLDNNHNYTFFSLFLLIKKDKLISFVNNDFSSFEEILTALKTSKGKIKFIELISNQLPTIINDSFKLKQILEVIH